MNIIEAPKKPYCKKNKKYNRHNLNIYNALLEKVEQMGVVSIDFAYIKSYEKRISILKNIIRLENEKRLFQK